MIGQTISHYHILEKLGEGGMGVVYKAQDTKLDRLVALKFLTERFATAQADRIRFLQEAKAAASLNHANICTIHGVEELNGELFIVMEYVDGVTLREREQTADQTLETVLTHAIQIGEALHEAHSKGIVHRDVKAENIMVNAKGQIKIMDFGLAKLKGALKLTRTSSTVGTVGYMAPEQIQGGEVDVRSDIFSFGVVLFEMLTGRLPFRGEHEAAMMYSIVHENPIPLEKYRPDIAPGVALIIAKAVQKATEDRYQNVAYMVADLRRVRRKSSPLLPLEDGSTNDSGSETRAGDRGFDIPAISIRKQRKQKVIIAAVAFLFIAAVIVAYVASMQRGAETITSLAVMPFTNATGDQSLEYLTDGITEGIINNLSRISSLRIMSRTSVFRYKGKEIDPQEVGKTLGVEAILTGRMTQRPNGFSVSFELVDSRDNRQIWGDQYIKSLANVSTLEAEIPREVSNQLKVKLSGEEREKLSEVSTANADAYQLYLKGRFNWNLRRPDALYRAIDLYTQAVERDPLYVQAYSGLAETYAVMPVYLFPPPREAFEKATYFAQKALEINPNHVEAVAALAYIKWGTLDFEGAEQDFKRAIEINPNYANAHHWFANFLAGDPKTRDKALSEILRARELDPLSLVIQTTAGNVYASAGRYGEAMANYQEVFKVDPDFPLARLVLGSLYLKTGKQEEALLQFEGVRPMLGDIVLPYIATAYALQGKRDDALKILAGLEKLAEKGERVEGPISFVYLVLGNKEKALMWLEKVYKSRYINVVHGLEWIALPKLTGLDSDPEIQHALEKIGYRLK